jgi:hypothetical protein
MKMTIVTNGEGKLVASVFEAPSYQQEKGAPSASLRPGPGQEFKDVDVPDEYAELSPDDLHRELLKYLGMKSE